jgi:hypothetical protein
MNKTVKLYSLIMMVSAVVVILLLRAIPAMAAIGVPSFVWLFIPSFIFDVAILKPVRDGTLPPIQGMERGTVFIVAAAANILLAQVL